MARHLDTENYFDKWVKKIVVNEFDDNLNESIAQLEFIRILTDQYDFTKELANKMTKIYFQKKTSCQINVKQKVYKCQTVI